MRTPSICRTLRLVSLAACCALVGCGGSSRRTNSGGPGPGNGQLPDLLEPGGTDVDGGPSNVDPGGTPDKPCSEQTFSPTKVGDPDILLIQDLSTSMLDGMPDKYSLTTAAII